jgi:SsrA-binding protein
MSEKTYYADLVSNRKAFHDYEIMDTFEAGIILTGTEVKSLRSHTGNLQDAYVLVSDGEAWLKNSSIPPYRFGNIYNHEEKRDRQLLMHKRELLKLKHLTQEKGLTIIPLSLYLKNNHVKVKIAVARGKKLYDKRAALKEKEAKRTIDRAMDK